MESSEMNRVIPETAAVEPPEVAMMKTMIVMSVSGFVIYIIQYVFGIVYE
jgi:hypothetical protein